MVVNLGRFWGRIDSQRPVHGSTPGASQILLIEPSVLKHIKAHRQLKLASAEAGGQLFGVVRETLVRVVAATGPYRSDERRRYHYRSNPSAAQKAVEMQSQAGLLYLGEWHTHAQDEPAASSSDIDAMARLLRHSALNVNLLLMIIVGRLDSLNGLNVSWVGFSGSVQWTLQGEVANGES